MGCKKLTYHETSSPLKVVCSDLNVNGNTCVGSYRYGFNGMEKDDNIKGAGNSYDFGARLYDPRVGRWLSIDPLEKEQPGFTPYKAFYNNPNLFIDPDGRIEWSIHKIINKKTGETKFVIHNVKSNKLRTNGVHTGPGWTKGTLNPFHSRREYYDIAHITTITIDKNGNRSYLYDTETLSKNEPRDEGLWEREKGYTISGESYDDAIANYYEGKEISSLKDLALVGDIIYLGDKIKEKSAQLYRGGIIANNDPTPGNINNGNLLGGKEEAYNELGQGIIRSYLDYRTKELKAEIAQLKYDRMIIVKELGWEDEDGSNQYNETSK